MSRRRRALAAVPAVGLLLVPSGAGAQEEPGSGLVSYRLVANAPGISLNGLYRDVDLTVPEVTSSLSTGAVGAGLSSLAWPGPVIGNAGSTILVLAPQAPPESVLLNSPVRAESRTGGQRKATNTTVPGTLMTTSAEPDEVTAAASTGESTVLPVASSGVMASSSRVALTGPGTVVAEAESSVERLSLLDGMVQIGSVTSAVTATSDGVTAKAEGVTTVSGMTIAGVPVSVDGTGVHVDGTDVPNPLPQQAVNDAIEALGLQVLLTEPRTTTSGGAVRHDAGALVLLFTQGESTYGMTIGRASVDVAATPAGGPEAVELPAPDAPAPFAPAAAPPSLTLPGTAAPLELPRVDSPPATPVAPAAAPVTAPPPLASSFVPAAFVLAGGVPTLLALLALGLVGLLAAGLRRLPDRVLALPPAECDERQS